MGKKILLFFVLLLLLSSCGGNNNNQNNQNNGNGNNQVEVVLETPILSFDKETKIVSWNKIDNATHYNYIINDGEILSTASLFLELSNEETVSVQAANNSSISEWSYSITNFDTSDINVEAKDNIYVKFHNTTLSTKTHGVGEKILKPADPYKENYTFDNWYKDPYYKEIFDFNEPIYSSTIIYANFVPSDLIKDTYFWIKADPKMSADVMSSGTGSNWHFIPLKVNEQNSSFKEFVATVNVTATTSEPCCFIVMDGFSDDSGRTYWKNNDNDFSITSSGIYNIYFSIEHQYEENIHVSIKKASNTKILKDELLQNVTLSTPVVSINTEENLASWNKVDNALNYQVIINNMEVIETSLTSITLDKGSFITVRAIGEDKYSNWSIPKANRNYNVGLDENNKCSVYFMGYESYLVDYNTLVNEVAPLSKEGFNFLGWYLDLSYTNKVIFPYEIKENTVFYPKWECIDDYENKVYYNLVLSDGSVISPLTWNLENYNFDEYQTDKVQLTQNTEYYIVSSNDQNVKYGPYKVEKTGTYTIYFSEDYLWDTGNVYFASSTKTIYFSCPKGWTDTVYVYVWSSITGDIYKYWPGSQMEYVETNGYGEKIYKIDIDISLYDSIIFTHGSNGVATGSQSVDISLTEHTNNGFYLTEKNSSGKYEFGTYSR